MNSFKLNFHNFSGTLLPPIFYAIFWNPNFNKPFINEFKNGPLVTKHSVCQLLYIYRYAWLNLISSCR